MKHLKLYKTFESTNIQRRKKIDWFDIIIKNNLNDIKEFVKDGYDYNSINVVNSWSGLMFAANAGYDLIVLYLLSLPNINATYEDDYGHNFIDLISDGRRYFLIDYRTQKKIIENDRTDIILLLNEYKLLHDWILEEYPYLKTGSDLNLL